jgi:hypothetical protein
VLVGGTAETSESRRSGSTESEMPREERASTSSYSETAWNTVTSSW